MLKQYSLTALQQAINATLSLDEHYHEKLAPLSGKVIKLIISPLDVSFYIQFTDNNINLLALYDGEPNTTIHSSPIGFIRLSLLPSSRARSLFNDKIRLSGDTEVGMAVKRLFDEIDIDWEGHIAQFTGDIIAHQLGRFVKKGLSKTRSINASLTRQMQEFIQNECQLTPSQAELDEFYHECDELTLATERLAAKINLFLQKKHENH